MLLVYALCLNQVASVRLTCEPINQGTDATSVYHYPTCASVRLTRYPTMAPVYCPPF